MKYRVRVRRMWATLVSTLVAASGCALLSPTAHATTSSPKIAYLDKDNYSVVIANPDGTNPETVPGSYRAMDFHWSPDGQSIYFENDRGVERYDLNRNDGVTTVSNVGPYDGSMLTIDGFAVDPSGGYVLPVDSAPDSSQGSIYAARTDGSAPAAAVQIASGADGGFFQPMVDQANGQLLALTNRGELLAINKDGSVTPVVTSGADGADVSPDGTKLALTENGTLYVASLTYSGSGPTATITGIGPLTQYATRASDPHWSPDGSEITFISNLAGVATVPADGGAATQLISLNGVSDAQIQPANAPASPASLQLAIPAPTLAPSPSPAPPPIYAKKNGLVAYLVNNGITVANADGSNPHALPVNSQIFDFTWAPDGSRLFFASDAVINGQWTYTIGSILPNGTDQVLVADQDVREGGPMALDATGAYLEYVSASRDGIDMVPANGSAPDSPTQVYADNGEIPGTWLDGIAIDPVNNQPVVNMNGGLYAFGPNGQDVRLAVCDGDTGSPVFSPDGTELAYTCYDGSWHIDVVTLVYTGGGTTSRIVGAADAPTILTTSSDNLAADQWAPDGSGIVYEQQAGTTSTIWTTAAGVGPTRLTAFGNPGEVEYQPVGGQVITVPITPPPGRGFGGGSPRP